jgi:hypothetical protein
VASVAVVVDDDDSQQMEFLTEKKMLQLHHQVVVLVFAFAEIIEIVATVEKQQLVDSGEKKRSLLFH